MGLFGSSKGKGKGTPGASSSRAPLPPPPPPAVTRFRPGRRRLHIPVHQARWHWEYRQPLPYPDVTLPHTWHLDPNRIPVPRIQRAHDDEVRRRRALLTPEQRRLPEYATDSPNREVWFALEHEEQWRSGVDAVLSLFPPPPPEVELEDMEAEAEYQAALEEALQHALEASRIDEDAH